MDLYQPINEEDDNAINATILSRTKSLSIKGNVDTSRGSMMKAAAFAFKHAYGDMRADDSDESGYEEDIRKSLGSVNPEKRRQLKSEYEEMKAGKIGPMATFFTLIKGFVATGVLFLPKGWVNGGWLFSSVAMLMS